MRAGHASVAQLDDAVDEDEPNAVGQLRGILVRRTIDDRSRIEYGDVGGHARCKVAAIDHADRVGRQRGHLANRVFPREHVLLAHVASEHAREAAPRARMLPRVQRRAAASIMPSSVPAPPCSRPCDFMCVTTGTRPAFSPMAIVSATPARELKFDSGVRRSWFGKFVRHLRAGSTTRTTSSTCAKYAGL